MFKFLVTISKNLNIKNIKNSDKNNMIIYNKYVKIGNIK